MAGHQPGTAAKVDGRGFGFEIFLLWELRTSHEDSTIPLLLGSKRAVDVIRKFKSEEREAQLEVVKMHPSNSNLARNEFEQTSPYPKAWTLRKVELE